MSTLYTKLFFIALAFSNARGFLTYWNQPNALHQVHSLYVKPSVDGTTGDLYVAATEESGSHYHPMNYIAAASQAHPTAVPYALSTSLTHTATPDESVTQKRAVLTGPTVKYNYGYPTAVSGAENAVAGYPYAMPAAMPTAAPVNTDGIGNCAIEAAPKPMAMPQYSPYPFFYPQMMSAAFATAMNAYKEASASEDGKEAAVGPQVHPMWAPYAYPFQYWSMDPTAWLQSQATQAAVTPASASTTATSEEASR